MIIPIRCFTCSKLIGHKYEEYVKLNEEKNKGKSNIDKSIDNRDIFKKLKIRRYCCRRMLMTQTDLLGKLL